ncbi:TonB-dependent siderophore receptor [Cereibacter changlensis JA139]|uniref:TonB-dependent siderophore receptor n=3 Tax=Cereibacter changlensis TaxID=402884 RepID=A0A2T4JQX7_9RHOB|nr:TonB-dependent siderophore receptor [Cereibacter changlensis JA139]PZX50043.1 iron complex outermembrane receptor protein [Cereibacter changlensis]
MQGMRGGLTALVAVAGLAAGGAQAQDAQRIDIPAQPLSAAVLQLGRSTGVQVVVDERLMAGRRSVAVRGVMTPQQALRIMLGESGLQPGQVDETLTMRPEASVAAEGTTLLGAIVVETEDAFGHVAGLVAHSSGAGTKTGAALRDVPQAVNVVTADQARAQGALSVVSVLSYTPGVVGQYGDTDIRHDWLTIRGFRPDRYADGLRQNFGARGYSQPRAEPFGLERTEVLKGPASVLYGQATPGGIVNVVSKRPVDREVREVDLSYGSYDRKQIGLDLGGRVAGSGDLLYRFVAVARDGDTEYDHVSERRVYVAPSLTWKVDDSLTVTAFAEYQDIDSPGGGGAPALPASGTLYEDPRGELPRSTFVGVPGYDHFENTHSQAGFKLEKKLGPNWTLNQALRYSDIEVDTQRVQLYCAAPACGPTQAVRYAWAFPETSELWSFDANLNGKLRTGAVEHDLLFGLDASRERSHFDETQLSYVQMGWDVFNPTPVSGSVSRPPVNLSIDQTRKQVGIYAQDQMTWGQAVFSAGLRYDRAETRTRTVSDSSDLTVDQEDDKLTGRLGAVYHLANGFSPYLGYSTSFYPAGGTDRNGATFRPTTADQFEIGLRYAPEGQPVMVTLSAFDLTQQNVLTPDPANTSFNTQTGEVRVRGLELEAKAELASGLQLVGSWTHNDAEITEDSRYEGNRPVYVPRTQAGLWLDYTVQSDNAWGGLSLGGGARYVGQTYGDNANAFSVPSFTLVDAAIRYDLAAFGYEGTKISLNVTNLADRKYVASCLSASGCYWGPGRAVTASLNHRW